MDAAAGIGSGGKEGLEGSEMEARAAEGMAELKKDHYCYYGYDIRMCIRIDHCERYIVSSSPSQAQMQGRKRCSKMIGRFPIVTTPL